VGLPDVLRVVPAQGTARVPEQDLFRRDAHPARGVASQVLVGEEEDAGTFCQRPGQHLSRVGRCADHPAVLAAERLQDGRRVDVGDRHHLPLHVQHPSQVAPRGLHQRQVGPVGQEASGLHIGDEDGLAGFGQDGRRFGHEVDAAENNVAGIGTDGVPRQLKAIPPEVGELDDFVPLVVVPQDDQVRSQSGLPGGYLLVQFCCLHFHKG